MILHITPRSDWEAALAQGAYTADSLASEGFVHCSTTAQVLGPANAFYRGQRDLVLLVIDPAKLAVEVVYEDLYDAGQAFPHIYGPLNLDAVTDVVDFPPNADGTFSLPPDVHQHGAQINPVRRHNVPILEFDDSPVALIEPAEILRPVDLPDRCVLCFFQDVIASLREAGRLRVVAELGSEMGRNPVYTLDTERGPLTVFHPGVGAPLAAAFLEELIALGGRRFIACGGCGALDPSLVAGHVVVPVSAVRDEGTSYHYLPPSREVEASSVAVIAIESVLREHGIEYVLGKTWTTDAIYRETPARIARRREERCITVEMEAAAFFAVARFRDVVFGQILYSGDDLTGEVWDGRGWHGWTTTREKLFWLAAEACLTL